MTLFTLRSVHKDFGIKEILRDASFSLEEGDKVGLIGTNGSGKSTLLKMIAGLEPFDSGDFWVNSGAKIVYLPQQPDMVEDHTVLEQVFADAGEKMALIREYEDISHHIAHGSGDQNALMSRLSTVTEKIDAADAWDLETNAKVILSKLGIEDFDARIGDLSGGYRKRVAIAAALVPPIASTGISLAIGIGLQNMLQVARLVVRGALTRLFGLLALPGLPGLLVRVGQDLHVLRDHVYGYEPLQVCALLCLVPDVFDFALVRGKHLLNIPQ